MFNLRICSCERGQIFGICANLWATSGPVSARLHQRVTVPRFARPSRLPFACLFRLRVALPQTSTCAGGAQQAMGGTATCYLMLISMTACTIACFESSGRALWLNVAWLDALNIVVGPAFPDSHVHFCAQLPLQLSIERRMRLKFCRTARICFPHVSATLHCDL